MMCGAATFASAPKPEFCPSMAGAPSEQIAETISHERSLSLKTSFTSFFTSVALVVRGLQNKKCPLLCCLSHSAQIQQAGLDRKHRSSRVGG